MDSASEQSSARPQSGHDGPRAAPATAFRAASDRFAELKSYAGDYLSARIDLAKLSIRRLIMMAALGVLALVAAGGLLLTAVVLLLVGIAHGIGNAFTPAKPWLGDLIVSVAVLAGTTLAVVLGVRKITGASRSKTVTKYESRHEQQRGKFGRDVTSGSAGTDFGGTDTGV
jgi:Putative Actinobacterial Holin-X, holin superfamily III